MPERVSRKVRRPLAELIRCTPWRVYVRRSLSLDRDENSLD